MSDVTWDAEVGARVRAARLAAGMSLEELGRLCGAGKATLSRIERGLEQVQLSRLSAIAKALGTSRARLLLGGGR